MGIRPLSLVRAFPRRLGALALVGLVGAACTDGDAANTLVGPDPSLVVTQQEAELFETFGELSEPWGTATIKRRSNGVKIELRVTDPEVRDALAGDAVTLWVASFHDPDECAGDLCGPGDLGNVDVGAALQGGGGKVLGNGPINLTANVKEGDDSRQVGGTAVGLVDAETDEIHVVVRSHGEPIPGKVAEQTSTPPGGCKTINGNPGPDPDGNDCVDVAVAIFLGP